VIVRSDGVPTYNFANPIDDGDMGITHVIRGEDLLSSTPRQVLVYEGLEAPVPAFAHLPLLFGPDKKRLSKRHGATSVEELREAGYLAEAVVNFLALMGWHFDSERELFTRDELVGLFSLERVNSAPAVFDAKKLEWMNGVYLRALPVFDLAERLTAFLRERGSPLAAQPERIIEVTPLAQEKISTLAEFAPLCSFLFGPVEIDAEAWDKVAGHERAAEIVAAVQAVLAGCEWTVEAIEAALRGVCDQLALKPRVVFGLIRVAVTGSSISPGLFESVHLLGREETLARLASAAARLG
jgi:glutamyl-tRNA synthetase